MWWLAFTSPLLRTYQQRCGKERAEGVHGVMHNIKSTLKGLGDTMRSIAHDVAAYVGIVLFAAVFRQSAVEFWILAIEVGMFQGGVQALSRSYFGKIIPKERSNEYKTFTGLFSTMRSISRDRVLLVFMIAFFFYIDGVHTVISMATSYGAALGIDSTQLVLALLVTQFVAFPSAIIYGKLAGRVGTLRMIVVAVAAYVGIVLFAAFFLKSAVEFWILAILVGMFQGGVQALSRSYFGKIIPKERSNEYYGFFDIFGRYASVMGTLLVSRHPGRHVPGRCAGALAQLLRQDHSQGALQRVLRFLRHLRPLRLRHGKSASICRDLAHARSFFRSAFHRDPARCGPGHASKALPNAGGAGIAPRLHTQPAHLTRGRAGSAYDAFRRALLVSVKPSVFRRWRTCRKRSIRRGPMPRRAQRAAQGTRVTSRGWG